MAFSLLAVCSVAREIIRKIILVLQEQWVSDNAPISRQMKLQKYALSTKGYVNLGLITLMFFPPFVKSHRRSITI
jgi:hypothetical protein